MGSMKDMFGDELYDVTKSRAARDVGLTTVETNNIAWMSQVMDFIQSLPQGWCGTGEDIRRIAPCGKPKHHNAWGAAISSAVKQKMLVRTGRRLRMRSVRSHARLTDEYRRT